MTSRGRGVWATRRGDLRIQCPTSDAIRSTANVSHGVFGQGDACIMADLTRPGQPRVRSILGGCSCLAILPPDRAASHHNSSNGKGLQIIACRARTGAPGTSAAMPV